MADRDKTHTVNVPGSDGSGDRKGANLDSVETQVLTDTSGLAVGMLTVTEGPGAGQMRAIYSGTNQVGRNKENRIPLDFGDNTISRHQHVVITYNQKKKDFRIFDGGKHNPVEVNGVRLAGDKSLVDGDLLKIGSTKLRFNVTA